MKPEYSDARVVHAGVPRRLRRVAAWIPAAAASVGLPRGPLRRPLHHAGPAPHVPCGQIGPVRQVPTCPSSSNLLKPARVAFVRHVGPCDQGLARVGSALHAASERGPARRRRAVPRRLSRRPGGHGSRAHPLRRLRHRRSRLRSRWGHRRAGDCRRRLRRADTSVRIGPSMPASARLFGEWLPRSGPASAPDAVVRGLRRTPLKTRLPAISSSICTPRSNPSEGNTLVMVGRRSTSTNSTSRRR